MSTESRRVRLFALQGGICAMCFKLMVSPTSKRRGGGLGRRKVTAEHVWPKRHFTGLAWNCVAAHRGCNEAKSDRLPTGCELIGLAWVQALREANGERIVKHETRAPTAPLPKDELWL